MNGVAAIRHLLASHTGLTGLVPAARIVTGLLPQGTTLPAVSIMSVSAVDRNLPNPGATRHVVERVQVTVMAANYSSLKAVMAQVKKAGADQMPAVAGIASVVVHTDGMSPDFLNEEASIYLQPIDFRIDFTETR